MIRSAAAALFFGERLFDNGSMLVGSSGARAIVATALVLGVSACNAVFGVDELRFETASASSSTSASASVGTTSSATGGGGSGGVAGAGGAGGVAPACPEVPPVDYEILRIAERTITIDGSCDEDLWQAAKPVGLANATDSDNAADCRFLWHEPTAGVLGCCVFSDTMLEAVETVHDGAVWMDDSLEYILSSDVARDGIGVSPKLILGASGVTRDERVMGVGDVDLGYEADVTFVVALDGTLNNLVDVDAGWTVEWESVHPFAPALDEVVLCDFMNDDRDAGVRTTLRAMGTGPASFNDPATWGQCRFACTLALP